MVLPQHVKRAAQLGQGDIVAAWVESGGGVDDVDGDGKERTLLIWATVGPIRPPKAEYGHIDKRHLALAQYLLERGADVNRSDHRGDTPLHYSSCARTDSSPTMVALLLKAGANVLTTSVEDSGSQTPFNTVLSRLMKHGPSPHRMKVALLLLRALPSLDHARHIPGFVPTSAEQFLNEAETRATADEGGGRGNCFRVLRTVVTGVRAAGGWRAYDRIPRAEILRLRSLALRRRAVFLPATTRRYDYPYIRSIEFLVRCPPEIAWHILGYWRCQYPVDTHLIDQLGFH